MSGRDITHGDLVLLACLMGVMATLVFYQYGSNNHISELPILQRAMDPGHLTRDFYTTASAGPGPRYYYAKVVAFFADPETLPYVLFALTLVCNVTIALASALCARWLFRGSNLAGAVAAILVMSGLGSRVFVEELTSSRIVIPLILLSVWSGLRQRPVIAALFGGAAGLLHPTFGLEGGAIAMGSSLVVALTREKAQGAAAPEHPWRRFAAGAGLFAGFAAIVVVPYLGATGIDSAQFVAIETYFRHPHHSVLGTIQPIEITSGWMFGIAACLAWAAWVRYARPGRSLAIGVAALVLGVAVVCVGGMLLFEMFPTRLLAVARPIRLLLLLKWMAFVLVGGLVGSYLGNGSWRLSLWPCVAGLAAAFSVLLVLFATGTRLGFGQPLSYCLAVLALLAFPEARTLRAGMAAVPVLLVMNLAWGPGLLPDRIVAMTARLRPSITLEERTGPDVDVARWAKANTRPSDIFLAPPDFGLFRLVAERALVVDFKAFPFQDAAMVAWQQRLFDCYGVPSSSGFEAEREMGETYRASDVEALAEIAARYDATYAVLELGMETTRPTLYENGTYKVVSLR